MKSLFILTLSLLLISSCNRSDGNLYNSPRSDEELKMTLEDRELNSPLKYLSGGELNMQTHQKKVRNGGLFREAEYENDGATISGRIQNNATLATYKDLNLTISFMSGTNTLLDEQSFVIYEYFKAGEETYISFRIPHVPSAMKTWSYRINGATPVYE
jgi:hypothetical protein